MTPIPLYTPTPIPDAWHAVTAPGGYEWWYFDAEDAATDTQVVAIFFDGFVFHPGYLRAYWRYRRNPTRVAPPVSRDYACAYFVVYQGGRIAYQFMTHYPASGFAASRDGLDVTVGPNRCAAAVDGSIDLTLSGTPWTLTGRGPRTRHGTTLAATLRFTPRSTHPPQERRFFSRELAGADHHWVVANPSCDVSGTITVNGGESDDVSITLDGRGYHDHNYGTGPIGPGLKHWLWGRILLDDGAIVFHRAEPTSGLARHGQRSETHVLRVRADGTAIVADDAQVSDEGSRRTAWGLWYPERLVSTGGVSFTAANPRVVDSSPFYMRLVYDARVDGKPCIAFCEVAHPHRLRWPVLGRMIEMSIDRRDRAK